MADLFCKDTEADASSSAEAEHGTGTDEPPSDARAKRTVSEAADLTSMHGSEPAAGERESGGCQGPDIVRKSKRAAFPNAASWEDPAATVCIHSDDEKHGWGHSEGGTVTPTTRESKRA